MDILSIVRGKPRSSVVSLMAILPGPRFNTKTVIPDKTTHRVSAWNIPTDIWTNAEFSVWECTLYCYIWASHGAAVVLLSIGFAINWWQNQVTRQPQFRHLTHIFKHFDITPDDLKPCSVWRISPSCLIYSSVNRANIVQIMACRLFGTKPLSKPIQGYCQLDPKEQI